MRTSHNAARREQIAYMAQHDALTGLPNRASFRDQMASAIPRGQGDKVAVLCIVSITLRLSTTHSAIRRRRPAAGHRRRLRNCRQRCVARLGGDEFGDQSGRAASELHRGRFKIVQHWQPFDVLGHRVVVGAAWALPSRPDGRDPDRLMKNADMALYRAKEEGRSAFRFARRRNGRQDAGRRTLELELQGTAAQRV